MNTSYTLYLDFDDTVFDTESLRKDIVLLLEKEGIPTPVIYDTMYASIGTDQSYFSYTFDTHLLALEHSGYPCAPIVRTQLSKLLEVNRLFPDVEEAMDLLATRCSHIYILTAGDTAFQHKKIDATPIGRWIDEVIVCHKDKYKEIQSRSPDRSPSVVSINDSLQQNIELRDRLPEISIVTKRNIHRNTPEEVRAAGFVPFDTLLHAARHLVSR